MARVNWRPRVGPADGNFRDRGAYDEQSFSRDDLVVLRSAEEDVMNVYRVGIGLLAVALLAVGVSPCVAQASNPGQTPPASAAAPAAQ
jgi:hypothetical protein